MIRTKLENVRARRYKGVRASCCIAFAAYNLLGAPAPGRRCGASRLSGGFVCVPPWLFVFPNSAQQVPRFDVCNGGSHPARHASCKCLHTVLYSWELVCCVDFPTVAQQEGHHKVILFLALQSTTALCYAIKPGDVAQLSFSHARSYR